MTLNSKSACAAQEAEQEPVPAVQAVALFDFAAEVSLWLLALQLRCRRRYRFAVGGVQTVTGTFGTVIQVSPLAATYFFELRAHNRRMMTSRSRRARLSWLQTKTLRVSTTANSIRLFTVLPVHES